MYQKLWFALSLFLISFGCATGHAAITSPDNTFVANDVYSTDFHTRLNTNFTQLTNGVNNVVTAQVTDDTLTEADMADEINPRIRTEEGASCEFVKEGMLPATDSDLTSDISAGTAYPKGFRINKASATAKTYTASKWTFVDIDQNGDFQFSEVAVDAATPSVASNSIRLARVSTDAATINTVTDLRKLSCASGPFDAIADVSGEGNLDHLLSAGSPGKYLGAGYLMGLQVSYDTATTFTVKDGSAYINGKYRTASGDISVPQTADDPLTEVSGLDTGAIAADTTYHVYAVADKDADPNLSISISANAATPSGITNFRRIGSVRTDENKNFVSEDPVTAAPGRVVQIFTSQDATYSSCAVQLPDDDTIATTSEGCELMRITVQPQNANHRMKVIAYAMFPLSTTTVVLSEAFFRSDTGTNARVISGGCAVEGGGSGPGCESTLLLDETAGTTATYDYIYHAGPGSAGTIYFNGDNTTRWFGGIAGSWIEVTEYER